jgi:hypothetical protein
VGRAHTPLTAALEHTQCTHIKREYNSTYSTRRISNDVPSHPSAQILWQGATAATLHRQNAAQHCSSVRLQLPVICTLATPLYLPEWRRTGTSAGPSCGTFVPSATSRWHALGVTRGSFPASAHRALSVALVQSQGYVYRSCALLLSRASGRPVIPAADTPYQASTTRRVARQKCENSEKSRRRAEGAEGNPAAAEWRSADVARCPEQCRGGFPRQILMLVAGVVLGFSRRSLQV